MLSPMNSSSRNSANPLIAEENNPWGYKRISGELKKMGRTHCSREENSITYQQDTEGV
jgi:hypothetical protein